MPEHKIVKNNINKILPLDCLTNARPNIKKKIIKDINNMINDGIATEE
jgi:hypothetical protein